MRHSLLTAVSLSVLTACSSAAPDGQETQSSDSSPSSGDATALSTSSAPTTGSPSSETNPTSEPGTTTGGSDSSDTEAASSGVGATSSGTTDAGTTADTDPSAGTSSSTTGEPGSSSTGEPGPDGDGDGAADDVDNCVDEPNPDQLDTDEDGIGDVCDPDDDNDKLLDEADNCPQGSNPGQEDLDKDGVGNVCDDDKDGDGVPNVDDNCPDLMNADQKDLDKDGYGDLCDEDKDGDGIADVADVFPDDPGQPGVVVPKQIYAHSSSTLYTVDVETYVVGNVGAFKWPNDGGGHQMTDVAIDRNGVLYGVTFDRLYVCNPGTAQCFNLGTLPGTYNGLTWLPAGIIDVDKDTLIGITNPGAWVQLTIKGGMVTAKQLGTYGASYTSAGDAFSIEGVGTFAAVNKAGVNSTVIVTVDPLNGKVTGELAVTQGYNAIYGLAGWEGLILAFNSNGQMIKVDPVTKVVTNLGNKGVVWWGAGVGTVIPQ